MYSVGLSAHEAQKGSSARLHENHRLAQKAIVEFDLKEWEAIVAQGRVMIHYIPGRVLSCQLGNYSHN